MPMATEASNDLESAPESPSIFGATPMNTNPNPTSVFSSSLNSPMRRLASFRKREDRDLSLKRPQHHLKSSPTSKRSRLSSTSSDVSLKSPAAAAPFSPVSPQKQVIVESGPVEPAAASDYEDEDELEPQSEDKILSAREILGDDYGNEEYEEEYYWKFYNNMPSFFTNLDSRV